MKRDGEREWSGERYSREKGVGGGCGGGCRFAKRGLPLGCFARGVVERVHGRGEGDGGESAESQEGEFGAEVSAFLSAFYVPHVCTLCAPPSAALWLV